MKTPAVISAVARPTEALQDVLRPLASLLSKSEKAQRKLAPGTWQHTMLQNNLHALRLAVALLGKTPGGTFRTAQADLQAALRAVASMIGRSENAQAKFHPGTAPHTLQRNRLQALRAAEARILAEMDKRPVRRKTR